MIARGLGLILCLEDCDAESLRSRRESSPGKDEQALCFEFLKIAKMPAEHVLLHFIGPFG